MAKQSTAFPYPGSSVAFDADMQLETTIASRDPNGRTLAFRLGDMPQAAIEKMLRYGAQRIFNDAIGGSDTTVEEKVAEAQAMIERFKAGQIGRTVATGVDAVTKLARQLARAALKATHKGTPEWARFMERTAEEQAAKLDAVIERNPHFRETAEKTLKARANVKVDVEGVEL